MIPHRADRVALDVESVEPLLEGPKIHPVIARIREDALFVVAARHDVHRHTGNVQAKWTAHAAARASFEPAAKGLQKCVIRGFADQASL